MLQQQEPMDFVKATGRQFSVRQFVEMAFETVGIKITWTGHGMDEVGIIDDIVKTKVFDYARASLKIGQIMVKINPAYFRPSEVNSLLGDSTNAKNLLGWKPQISFEELVSEMVLADLNIVTEP